MISIKYQGWGFTPPVAANRPERIVLGPDADGDEVTIDLDMLHAGRLLIQGPSGAGKSTLLRRLMAQCASFIQYAILDPEGEHKQEHTLFRTNPAQGANDAKWLRGNSTSCAINISDMTREQQLRYATEFIHGLIDAPREQWNNRLVVIIDEVEIFTPQSADTFDEPKVAKRSKQALVELMSRGRKRGLISVIATHRLTQLAPSVRAEARNFLIGGSSSDIDISRAARAIGWSEQKAFQILPKLPVGCFVAVGQCFSKSQTIVRIPTT